MGVHFIIDKKKVCYGQKSISFNIMTSYGVDFQYFRQPGGDLLVKEMAIIPFEKDTTPIVLLFKAPYPWCQLSEKYKTKNDYI